MHETYKEMMRQQSLSPQAKMDFYNDLESAVPAPKKTACRKLLIAAACLCLLIPLAVLAAENIFDVAKAKFSQYTDINGETFPSYEIDFETDQELPLESISEKWRYIESGQIVTYESWEEAQLDMGIDLLENTVLSTAKIAKTIPLDTEGKSQNVHCYNLYRALDGQLYSISNQVSYNVEGILIRMDTEILVEHPTLPQEVKDVFTAMIYIGDEETLQTFQSEQYTSPSGLTATFVSADSDDLPLVLFRANGVRYRLMVEGISSNDPYTAREILLKILDGFVIP